MRVSLPQASALSATPKKSTAYAPLLPPFLPLLARSPPPFVFLFGFFFFFLLLIFLSLMFIIMFMFIFFTGRRSVCLTPIAQSIIVVCR